MNKMVLLYVIIGAILVGIILDAFTEYLMKLTAFGAVLTLAGIGLFIYFLINWSLTNKLEPVIMYLQSII